MTFNYYQTPSHGYVGIDLAVLVAMGIADAVSECSYIEGRCAYLEEDADAPMFLEAFKARFGGYSLDYIDVGEDWLRGKQSYSSDAYKPC